MGLDLFAGANLHIDREQIILAVELYAMAREIDHDDGVVGRLDILDEFIDHGKDGLVAHIGRLAGGKAALFQRCRHHLDIVFRIAQWGRHLIAAVADQKCETFLDHCRAGRAGKDEHCESTRNEPLHNHFPRACRPCLPVRWRKYSLN